MNGPTRWAGALLALALVGGCGAQTGSSSSEEEQVTTGFPVTVIDDGDGAELCLGGVAESLPPQCSGPRLLGWSWEDQAGRFEEAGGTRWGDFVVTGTFDGEDLSPTEVVPAADWEEPDAEAAAEGSWGERDLTTPCPEPAGEWRPVDPAATSERTQQ